MAIQIPQAPYVPVPEVAAQNSGPRGINLGVTSGAFGGDVGKAVEGLGSTISGAGNEMFGRAKALQELQNDTEAKEADSDYIIKAGELHANYNSLQGKAAVDAYPKYANDLKELRVKMREGLSNDAVRRSFDGPSLSTMGRSIFNGAGHAATENKRYVVGASVSRVDASKEAIHQSPDESTYRQGVAVLEDEIRGTQSAIAGWSKEKEDEEVSKAKSDLRATQIIGLARTQPSFAKSLLDANKGELRKEDFDRADKAVIGQLRTTGARVIVGNNLTDLQADPESMKGGSLNERIERAMTEAEKIAPDDPLMKDVVRDRMIADYNKIKAIKRDGDLVNEGFVREGILGGAKNIDELRSMPGMEKAIDALPLQKQLAIPGEINRYVKARFQHTQEVNYWRLLGLAETNPDAFMDIEVTKEQLSQSDMRKLWALQEQKRKNADADPRVLFAMQILRPMANAAGVSPKQNLDRYYQFVGALQDQLVEATRDNKTPPKVEEINKIGMRLLQKQQDIDVTPSALPNFSTIGAAFKVIFGSGDSTFEMPVPSQEATTIKNDPKWSTMGVVPDDKMVQRVYARKRYQELYGKKTTPAPTGPTPPVSR